MLIKDKLILENISKNFIGIFVLIKCPPSGAIRICMTKVLDTIKLLRKLDSMLKLLPDSSISSTFNVSDLTEYREPTVIPSEAFELDSLFESEPNLECPQMA